AYFDAGKGGSQRGLIALDYALEQPLYELRARAFVGYRRLRLFENFTGYLYDPEDIDEPSYFEDPERGDYRLQRHAASSFGGDVLGRVRPASDWTITAGAGLRGDILTQREDRAGRDGEAREQRRGLAGTQLLGNVRGSLSYRPNRA